MYKIIVCRFKLILKMPYKKIYIIMEMELTPKMKVKKIRSKIIVKI